MANYLTAGAMALAGFVITAGIATATPRDPLPNADATPAATATTKAPVAEKRYCVVDSVTGSRIPQRVCKTAREWKADGVDVTNL